MDILTKEQRKKTMKSVKSKDSKIELKLRKALYRKGYRYRKNYSKVLGKPDILFKSHRVAIFCDSEFWHGYCWEKRKYDIKSNREFWWPKIEKNINRDKEVTKKLKETGWTVLRFWDHEIENDLNGCLEIIEKTLHKKKLTIKE